MLLVFLPFGLAWHSELTNALLGDENAKRARAAQAEGAEHWEEVGVGIGPEGQPYAMGIARGKAYEHIQPGLFLVASANVKGGIFAESVNLIIHHDTNGSLALMVVLAQVAHRQHPREDAPRLPLPAQARSEQVVADDVTDLVVAVGVRAVRQPRTAERVAVHVTSARRHLRARN